MGTTFSLIVWALSKAKGMTGKMKKEILCIGMLIFILSFRSDINTILPDTSENMLITTASENNKIQSRANIYEWRYKVKNNKLYKRLYNCTRHEWTGNWILIN